MPKYTYQYHYPLSTAIQYNGGRQSRYRSSSSSSSSFSSSSSSSASSSSSSATRPPRYNVNDRVRYELYVDNLAPSVTRVDLWQHFAWYDLIDCAVYPGLVKQRKNILQRQQQQRKRPHPYTLQHGFIQFDTKKGAIDALNYLNHSELHGRRMYITWSDYSDWLPAEWIVTLKNLGSLSMLCDTCACAIIRHLPVDVAEEQLFYEMCKYGTVLSHTIARVGQSGRSRRYAFIQYDRYDGVQVAISQLNGKSFPISPYVATNWCAKMSSEVYQKFVQNRIVYVNWYDPLNHLSSIHASVIVGPLFDTLKDEKILKIVFDKLAEGIGVVIEVKFILMSQQQPSSYEAVITFDYYDAVEYILQRVAPKHGLATVKTLDGKIYQIWIKHWPPSQYTFGGGSGSGGGGGGGGGRDVSSDFGTGSYVDSTTTTTTTTTTTATSVPSDYGSSWPTTTTSTTPIQSPSPTVGTGCVSTSPFITSSGVGTGGGSTSPITTNGVVGTSGVGVSTTAVTSSSLRTTVGTGSVSTPPFTTSSGVGTSGVGVGTTSSPLRTTVGSTPPFTTSGVVGTSGVGVSTTAVTFSPLRTTVGSTPPFTTTCGVVGTSGVGVSTTSSPLRTTVGTGSVSTPPFTTSSGIGTSGVSVSTTVLSTFPTIAVTSAPPVTTVSSATPTIPVTSAPLTTTVSSTTPTIPVTSASPATTASSTTSTIPVSSTTPTIQVSSTTPTIPVTSASPATTAFSTTPTIPVSSATPTMPVTSVPPATTVSSATPTMPVTSAPPATTVSSTTQTIPVTSASPTTIVTSTSSTMPVTSATPTTTLITSAPQTTTVTSTSPTTTVTSASPTTTVTLTPSKRVGAKDPVTSSKTGFATKSLLRGTQSKPQSSQYSSIDVIVPLRKKSTKPRSDTDDYDNYELD